MESVDVETAPVENGHAEGEGSTLAKKFSKLSVFRKSKGAVQIPQSMSSSNLFLKTLLNSFFSLTLSFFFLEITPKLKKRSSSSGAGGVDDFVPDGEL